MANDKQVMKVVISTASDGLTFDALRQANAERLPQFKNKHGQLAHSKEDGSDWTPAQWLQAVLGELGEYANLRKKFERGDLSAEEFATEAAKELADVQTYLDILARRCLDTADAAHPDGVDLGQATIDKFNEVSERVGSTVRLEAVKDDDPTDTSQAMIDVCVERLRQQEAEGWTPEHDDEHSHGELALAAGWYALNSPYVGHRECVGVADPQCEAHSLFRNDGYGAFAWPWAIEWWKPKSQRRDLVRAGALIIAEIERLDRATAANESEASANT